ncbi:carbohydrate phosphatase [Mytilinidion resinicola]|uniref:Carbohydrate phosphatase n=1 Tax=Mytilinidion resinicola TaxID=574789 RepID=A0A6A6YNN7_9PEZI|nr:carbohydrate phosphatase [Mytilinidion resinicola]KAF2809624.1 carbohydrate phosphatase [Mytilinidion resinicola]
MSPNYTPDLHLALHTVHRATLLTKSILRFLNNSVAAETKADASPVTIADFAAQCLIITAIRAVHPSDSFVGEESAAALRSNLALREAVWALVSSASSEALTGLGEDDPVGELAVPQTMEEMLDVIDVGVGEQTARGRVWVLDPVDGTATFMKGQQYVVALALLEDGVQKVGVLAAPNLLWDASAGAGEQKIHEDLVDEEGWGVVLSAVEGEGAWVRRIEEEGFGEAVRIGVGAKEKELKELDFVEVAPGSTTLSQESHRRVAEGLGAKWPGTQLWSQQMKYVALSLGAVDVMLRIPKTKDRFTQVWDHAGGQLIFQEAGGKIRDLNGGTIDLAQGRKIQGERNFGMIATRPGYWEKISEAMKEAVADSGF